MKLSDLTLLFVITHLLSDYHLQSQQLADAKRGSSSALLRHALIVGAVHLLAAGLCALWGQGLMVMGLAASVFLIHWVLDALKSAVRSQTGRGQAAIYLIDQALHLTAILFLCEVAFPKLTGMALVPSGQRELLIGALTLALITKPANVTFKVLFSHYQMPEKDGNAAETVPGAGALVGNMERLISVILLSASQYAALGLIYTAKSIARFKQIEQSKRFAEYYLIGTLYSVLYVLLCHQLILVIR